MLSDKKFSSEDGKILCGEAWDLQGHREKNCRTLRQTGAKLFICKDRIPSRIHGTTRTDIEATPCGPFYMLSDKKFSSEDDEILCEEAWDTQEHREKNRRTLTQTGAKLFICKDRSLSRAGTVQYISITAGKSCICLKKNTDKLSNST